MTEEKEFFSLTIPSTVSVRKLTKENHQDVFFRRRRSKSAKLFEDPVEYLHRSGEGGSGSGTGATSDTSWDTAAQLVDFLEGLRFHRSHACTALSAAGRYLGGCRK